MLVVMTGESTRFLPQKSQHSHLSTWNHLCYNSIAVLASKVAAASWMNYSVNFKQSLRGFWQIHNYNYINRVNGLTTNNKHIFTTLIYLNITACLQLVSIDGRWIVVILHLSWAWTANIFYHDDLEWNDTIIQNIFFIVYKYHNWNNHTNTHNYKITLSPTLSTINLQCLRFWDYISFMKSYYRFM